MSNEDEEINVLAKILTSINSVQKIRLSGMERIAKNIVYRVKTNKESITDIIKEFKINNTEIYTIENPMFCIARRVSIRAYAGLL